VGVFQLGGIILESAVGFHSSSKWICRGALFVIFSLGTGCGTLKYLFQAGRGQMALAQHAKPLEEVIRDERTPQRTIRLLRWIPRVKEFGEFRGLKPTQNYSQYVNLNRSAAVWVVTACDSVEFIPREWSFPIVGSFPYLGWFDQQDAIDYASELKKEGWDVDLRGAGAYSTLGWFRDSILSTMISSGEEALGHLVNIVFHESVHATLYIQDQSFFNESLADFLAEALTLEFLDQNLGKSSLEKKAYLAQEEKSKHAQRLLHQAYSDLDLIYRSTLSKDEKLQKKTQWMKRLQHDLGWKREINNATLIQYKTYHADGLGFEELYQACGRHSQRFLATLAQLGSHSFSSPQQSDFKQVILSLIPSCSQQSQSQSIREDSP